MDDHSSKHMLECGTAIIRIFQAERLSWKAMMAEWLDNSFGAGATKVKFRKSGQTLEIIDNGLGCDDLKRMESLARSIKTAGNKASMYGIGGVKSQINASQAGLVVVHSVTREKTSRIAINWGECLEADRLEASQFSETPTLPGAKIGTTITIHTCKRIKEVSRLIRDLGYFYSAELRNGKSIILEIDDDSTRVKPYATPPLSRRIDFDFDHEGHRISGFCGQVEKAHPNPYPGWSFHWGYRFIGQYHEPADGRPTNRIYAVVNLPESWRNINVTKDAFSQDPDTLMEALADRCRPIVEAADAESQEIELTSASRLAEVLLGQALKNSKRVKGARPGDAGKSGTEDPTGEGSPHRNFTTSQPGDKGDEDGPLPGKVPDRVRIDWDETIEGPYQLATSGTNRSRTFVLTLNSGISQIAEFRHDPSKLATYCLVFVAKEIAEGPPNIQKFFPSFRDLEFKDIYSRLLRRIATGARPEDQVA